MGSALRQDADEGLKLNAGKTTCDVAVVNISHENGDCDRGIANGLIVSLQSDGPAPCRCKMGINILNHFATVQLRTGNQRKNANLPVRVGFLHV